MCIQKKIGNFIYKVIYKDRNVYKVYIKILFVYKINVYT